MKTFFHWLGKGGGPAPAPVVPSNASVLADKCKRIANQILDNDTGGRFGDVRELLDQAGDELRRLQSNIDNLHIEHGDIAG